MHVSMKDNKSTGQATIVGNFIFWVNEIILAYG